MNKKGKKFISVQVFERAVKEVIPPISDREELLLWYTVIISLTGKEGCENSLCNHTPTDLSELCSEVLHFMLLLCTKYEAKSKIQIYSENKFE